MLDQTQVCCPACTSPRVSAIGKDSNRYQGPQRLRCKVCGHRFTVWGMALGLMPEVVPVTDAVIAKFDQPDSDQDDTEDTGDAIDPYEEAIQSSFGVLQSLLTQYPTVRQMVQTQPQLPAQNIVALFAALDNLIDHWQLEPIGTVWAKVAYDPQLHQGDQGDLQLGEDVYVRFMGYRRGDRILVPARVSRQLPSGSVPV
jgi:transcription elongation factor Elf1